MDSIVLSNYMSQHLGLPLDLMKSKSTGWKLVYVQPKFCLENYCTVLCHINRMRNLHKYSFTVRWVSFCYYSSGMPSLWDLQLTCHDLVQITFSLPSGSLCGMSTFLSLPDSPLWALWGYPPMPHPAMVLHWEFSHCCCHHYTCHYCSVVASRGHKTCYSRLLCQCSWNWPVSALWLLLAGLKDTFHVLLVYVYCTSCFMWLFCPFSLLAFDTTAPVVFTSVFNNHTMSCCPPSGPLL